MGVHNLWKILDPVKEPIKLETLRGQTLAVDLSVWICDAQGVKQMQGVVAKPHLRNLFFRVSHLLQLGVSLIFVVDGEAPELKWEAMMMRQQARFGHAGVRTGGKPAKKPGRSHFRRLINECCQMLDYLGVPYVQSVGEAEAFCALLNKLGIADSVITQDGDAFLYGATKVYKNFSISGKDAQIESYSMEHVNAKLHLNRDKLIALGLLLGCDYVPKGVPGVGKETAMKFMMTYRETTSVLERFREWRAHPSSKVDSTIEGKLKGKALVVKEFPFEKVIEEFTVVKDKCPKRALTWKKPQIDKLYEFNEKMEWPSAYTNEKIIPLLTLHDMRTRRKNHSHPSEPKPERIVKARVRQFVPCFEVQWEKLECDTDPENTAEFYTTFEEKEMFTECYPELVSAFEEAANKKSVKGEKKKRTSKKKAAGVNLDSELCIVMDDVVDGLKLSDLTLEDSAKVVKEPEILAAKTCSIPPYMNVPYSYEGSMGTTTCRTSRESLVISQSREISVSSSICTLKETRKKLQNASRESHCDLLAIPGRSGLVGTEPDADDHGEPADLVTRLRRLRLQSSEPPLAESRNESKTHGATDDSIFDKSYDNESCMRQSLQGSDVPFTCMGQNQTPSGITFQSFNDSSLIRESEKLQEDHPASGTDVSYSCCTDVSYSCGTDVSYSCGTDVSYSCVVSPCPVAVDRADQTGTSFRSLNDSVLLKESNRVYLDRPELYQTIDQCFGDSSMLSESHVYGYTRGAKAKGGCALDEDEKLGKSRTESDALYIYQPELNQTIDQCSGDSSMLSESQVYGFTRGARVCVDCSLDRAEKPFENVESACPSETRFDEDVGSGLSVESLEDKDTQLYDEPSSVALEDKDTQLYDEPISESLEDKDTRLNDEPSSEALEDMDTQLYEEPSSESLEDKDTRLYDEPSSEALEDMDTQLYDEPSSEALEDKDTRLYDEPSSEALEDKDTRLYDEPSSEGLEDMDTQLYDEPSSEALEDKDTRLYDEPSSEALEDMDTQLYDEPSSEALEEMDTRLYDEPGSEALEDKDTRLYDEPGSEALEDNESGHVRNNSIGVGTVIKQEPLTPRSVYKPFSSRPEHSHNQRGKFGGSVPVALGDQSGHVVIKQEVVSPKCVSDVGPVGTSRHNSGGIVIKQEATSPSGRSRSSTSLELTSETDLGRCVIKKEVISPKCRTRVRSVGLKSQATCNLGSLTVKQEITSPSHCSRNSTSLVPTSLATSGGLIPKQEEVKPSRCSSLLECAVKIKSEKDEVSGTCKVAPVPGYTKVTPVPDYTKVLLVQDYTKVAPVPGYTKVTPGPDYTKVAPVPGYTKVTPVPDYTKVLLVQDYTKVAPVPGYTKVTPVPDYTKVLLVQDYTKVAPVPGYTKVTPGPDYTKVTLVPDYSKVHVHVRPVHDYTYHDNIVKREINSPQNHVETSKNVDLIGKVNQVKAKTLDFCGEMKSSGLMSNSVHLKSETVPIDSELVEFQPKFGETVTGLSSDGVRHVKMGQFEADPQEMLSVSDIFSSDSMSKCSSEKLLERPSDQWKRDSSSRHHHSYGHVDAVLRGQDLEPALLFDDTVVSCAPGCEDAMGCDEDIGVEMCRPETDENRALAGPSHDPDPDVGVRTRRGRPKKAKIGKKKKPKKKIKVCDDHDMNSILRQLETTTSCPSSPAVLSLQSEKDLLELLKAVATPESANVPRRWPSVIPTDSQLDDLLNQIEAPTSPLVPDNQHDVSPVALVQQLNPSCRTPESVGAESQENSPLLGLPSGPVLSEVLGARGNPTLCTTSADGSLLSEELRDLLKDIQTPVLNGRDKENLPHRSGTIMLTPGGDVDASLLMNLVSAWPSGKKQQPKKGRRKTRRKRIVPLAPLALNEVEDAGTL